MDDKDKNNGYTLLVVGSSGSGKSTILSKVLLKHVWCKNSPTEKEYIVVLFTESMQSDAIDLKWLKKQGVVVTKVLCEDTIGWAYQMNERYGKDKYHFVFILDDIIHIRFKKVFEKCMLIFRNSNITTVVSLQHATHIPRSVRGSAYGVIALPTNSPESIEIMVRSFLSLYLQGMIRDKCVQYKEHATDFRGFFIDNINHKAFKFDAEYNCKEIYVCPEQSASGWKDAKGYETE
jgi:hypothetical protein